MGSISSKNKSVKHALKLGSKLGEVLERSPNSKSFDHRSQMASIKEHTATTEKSQTGGAAMTAMKQSNMHRSTVVTIGEALD